VTGAEEAELVLGVGSAVRGAMKVTSQAMSTRGRARVEKARTERILSVIGALPPGGEWIETDADGTQWTVRIPRSSAPVGCIP
jgi:hypothetical protein